MGTLSRAGTMLFKLFASCCNKLSILKANNLLPEDSFLGEQILSFKGRVYFGRPLPSRKANRK